MTSQTESEFRALALERMLDELKQELVGTDLERLVDIITRDVLNMSNELQAKDAALEVAFTDLNNFVQYAPSDLHHSLKRAARAVALALYKPHR